MKETEKSIKIIACDDDTIFLDILSDKITEVMGQTQMAFQLTKCCTVDSILDRFEPMADLYFLDIDMPGVSGLELAAHIMDENPEATVMFVSNHDEMVFEAIHYAPFRFVRKEKLEEELPEAILSWLQKREVRRKKGDGLWISAKEGKLFLFPSDIFYLESYRHYLLFRCGDRTYETRGKLSDYEMLLKPYGFVRVNISYLVNCRYIRSLRAGKVVLHTEEEITVSRAKREEVKHVYMEYARRKLGWQ